MECLGLVLRGDRMNKLVCFVCEKEFDRHEQCVILSNEAPVYLCEDCSEKQQHITVCNSDGCE